MRPRWQAVAAAHGVSVQRSVVVRAWADALRRMQGKCGCGGAQKPRIVELDTAMGMVGCCCASGVSGGRQPACVVLLSSLLVVRSAPLSSNYAVVPVRLLPHDDPFDALTAGLCKGFTRVQRFRVQQTASMGNGSLHTKHSTAALHAACSGGDNTAVDEHSLRLTSIVAVSCTTKQHPYAYRNMLFKGGNDRKKPKVCSFVHLCRAACSAAPPSTLKGANPLPTCFNTVINSGTPRT